MNSVFETLQSAAADLRQVRDDVYIALQEGISAARRANGWRGDREAGAQYVDRMARVWPDVALLAVVPIVEMPAAAWRLHDDRRTAEHVERVGQFRILGTVDVHHG